MNFLGQGCQKLKVLQTDTQETDATEAFAVLTIYYIFAALSRDHGSWSLLSGYTLMASRSLV